MIAIIIPRLGSGINKVEVEVCRLLLKALAKIAFLPCDL